LNWEERVMYQIFITVGLLFALLVTPSRGASDDKPKEPVSFKGKWKAVRGQWVTEDNKVVDHKDIVLEIEEGTEGKLKAEVKYPNFGGNRLKGERLSTSSMQMTGTWFFAGECKVMGRLRGEELILHCEDRQKDKPATFGYFVLKRADP